MDKRWSVRSTAPGASWSRVVDVGCTGENADFDAEPGGVSGTLPGAAVRGYYTALGIELPAWG